DCKRGHPAKEQSIMLFTADFIKECFSDCDGMYDPSKEIEHVFTDSREEKVNSLFIPLVGDKFDGHTFLSAAISSGAVATLWQKISQSQKTFQMIFCFFMWRILLRHCNNWPKHIEHS